MTITLTFESFRMEDAGCGYDHFTIYDGDSGSSAQIVKLCGVDLPSPVTSSSNVMHMQ